MVISFSVGIYTRQEKNGGILMGLGDPNEPIGTWVGSSIHFLFEMSAGSSDCSLNSKACESFANGRDCTR